MKTALFLLALLLVAFAGIGVGQDSTTVSPTATSAGSGDGQDTATTTVATTTKKSIMRGIMDSMPETMGKVSGMYSIIMKNLRCTPFTIVSTSQICGYSLL